MSSQRVRVSEILESLESVANLQEEVKRAGEESKWSLSRCSIAAFRMTQDIPRCLLALDRSGQIERTQA